METLRRKVVELKQILDNLSGKHFQNQLSSISKEPSQTEIQKKIIA